jgi:hypothetical protein
LPRGYLERLMSMGIARKIELYNQALQLARGHIAKDPVLNDRAGITAQLHDAIRHELQAGGADPVSVAANAIRTLQKQI